jgi:hypothetical protein
MDDSKQRKKPVVRKIVHVSGFEVFTFDSVLLKDWVIKASASSHDSILVVMRNVKTGEVLSNFFTDETEANDFINYYV